MQLERLNYKSAGAVRKNRPERLQPYVSTAALKFTPGNFVTEGTTDKVGVTLAIADPTEANPMVKVKWLRDLSVEWLRSEYLYLAAA